MGLRRKITALAVALLSALAVVLLPSEAWGAPAQGQWFGGPQSVAYYYGTSGSYSFGSLTASYVDGGMSYGATAQGTMYAHSGVVATGGHAAYQSQYACVNTPTSYTSGGGGGWSISAGTDTITNVLFADYCGSGQGGTAVIQLRWAASFSSTGTVLTYTQWYTYYPAGAPAITPTASTCTSPVQHGLAVTNGSVLSLSFGWSATLPASAWNIRDGYNSTDPLIGTLGKSYRPGTTNFGGDGLAMVVPAGDPVRIESATTPSCYGVIISTAGGTSLTDTSGLPTAAGGSCSLLDLFCQIRALFTPSASGMSDWQGQVASWQTHAPVSLVITGYQALGDFAYGLTCGTTGTPPAGTIGLPSSCLSGDSGQNTGLSYAGGSGSLSLTLGYSHNGHSAGGTASMDILGGLATYMGVGGPGHWIYTLLAALVWLGFAYWLWQRAGWSFGSKEKP